MLGHVLFFEFYIMLVYVCVCVCNALLGTANGNTEGLSESEFQRRTEVGQGWRKENNK